MFLMLRKVLYQEYLEFHPYHECDNCDESDFDFIEKSLKLQKCPKCSAIIEKNGGCRHMSCPCGAHFCSECPNNKKDIFLTEK